jgi:RNA ligase (TIGR02306 family)
MSEFNCPVISVGTLKPVPNSDALEMTWVFETPVIVRKGQLKSGDLAVYIPLDAVVPMDRQQFQGLGIKTEKTLYRVKAVRLRGTYSEGLLVPFAPYANVHASFADQAVLGKDMAPDWGITKYEEAARPESIFGKAVPAQQDQDIAWVPKYKVEQLVKNREAIPEGLEVVVTEKLHGCNARYVLTKDGLKVGSHNTWRKAVYTEKPWLRKVKTFLNKLGFKFKLADPVNDDVWWRIAKKYDLVNRMTKLAPNTVIYGEIFGNVQDLKYGLGDDIDFRVFDVYYGDMGWWTNYDTVLAYCRELGLKPVPVLYRGPYSMAVVDGLRSGKSILDNKTIREGFVIRPADLDDDRLETDMTDKQAFKYVSEDYKLRKGETTEFH